MVSLWIVITVGIGYLALLFAIAYLGDQLAKEMSPQGPVGRFFRSERVRGSIYALTLAVYCTTWTYYGSVGVAANTGYNFLPIYLGPILILIVGYPLYRRLLRVSKAQGITSIADFLAARYGKSQALGAVATGLAVFGALPYIALQLKAVAMSFHVLVTEQSWAKPLPDPATTPLAQDSAFWVAALLAVFAILFGTRHVDSTEHHRGMMLAIAFESLIKLVAFLAVGSFVTFTYFGGPRELTETALAMPQIREVFTSGIDPVFWITTTLLAALAFLCLPRQFHVAVVENENQNHLRTAAWLFPAYLFAINLFVIPLAMAGSTLFPTAAASDAYVLHLPLLANQVELALFAYVGGLSAATAMVIVATIALSTMVCNHIVVPLILRRQSDGAPAALGGEQGLKLIRRVAIIVILGLAYGYYRFLTGDKALADIGLLSFAAASQFAPALIAGLFWKRGTKQGALVGMSAGFAVWAYLLLIPTIGQAGLLPQSWLESGMFLLPGEARYSFFGLLELDFLSNGALWSLSVNIALFVLLSLIGERRPIDEAQANAFVRAETKIEGLLDGSYGPIPRSALFSVAERFLGSERTVRAFLARSEVFGTDFLSEEPANPDQILATERLLASSIGAASARAVMALSLNRRSIDRKGARQLLDTASEAIRFNQDILHATLENIRQGVAVFDRDLRLAVSNRSFTEILELPGYLHQIGVPLTDIIDYLASKGDLGEGHPEPLAKARLEELLDQKTTIIDRRRPSGRIYEVRSDPMPEGGVILTYTDVTDRVTAAEALRAANEGLEARVAERTSELLALNKALEEAKSAAETANATKSRFLAAASHDVLQPLNAARLFSAALKDRLERASSDGAPLADPLDPEGPQTDEIAQNVERSLESLDELLGALVEISKLDTNAEKPELSTFDVGDLLSLLQTEFSAIAQEKGVVLRTVPCGQPVVSDRRMLRRILQNLMSNAIRYSPNGRVLVGCRRDGGQLRVEVLDTGPGISKADQEEVFKEFKRLKPDRDRSLPEGERSLGLGLAIVERMAGLLGHPLTLRSQPGKGSAFCVSVPIAQATPLPKAIPKPKRPVLPVFQGAEILCYDDDRSILVGLQTLLGGWGCRVRLAGRLEEAAEDLERHGPPQVMIIDYHLEADRDGITALSELREASGYAGPVLFITAESSPEMAAQAKRVGAQLMKKPVKPANLRARLTALLEEHAGVTRQSAE